MKKFNTKKLVFLAILIAINVILTRYVSIRTPVVRIGFNFIAVALTSAFFGPLTGGLANVVADIVGMLISPLGDFFPGFTLSAFITGAVYGIFLHNKEITTKRIVGACAVNSLGVSLFLNTLWVHILSGADIRALLSVRIPQALFSFILHVIILRLILPSLLKQVKKLYKA